MSLAHAINVYYRYQKKEKTYHRGGIIFRNHRHIISIDHASFFQICNCDEERKERLIRQLEQESVTIKKIILILQLHIRNVLQLNKLQSNLYIHKLTFSLYLFL